MTILPHVDNIQDNGYFCGPATLQVVLGVRGVAISEAQAAIEAHTTVDGTPTIDNLVAVLNDHLGAGTYRSVWIGGNSATPEQVAQLRADITGSIAAGYAVAINVVGQATGTLADGRTEVNLYSGGHYIPVTGTTDGAGLPWLTDVADGHEYSMTWQALADWIAGRGYATITSTLEDDMTPDQARKLDNVERLLTTWADGRQPFGIKYTMDDPGRGLPNPFVDLGKKVDGLSAGAVDVKALAAELAADADFVKAIAKAVNDDAAARLAE